MSVSHIVALILLVATAAAYYRGRERAMAAAGGAPSRLHSMPGYSGYYVAILTGLPAFALLTLYAVFGTPLINSAVMQGLPAGVANAPPEQVELFMRDARALAFGEQPSRTSALHLEIADRIAGLTRTATWIVALLTLAIAAAGFYLGQSQVSTTLRARNRVETVVKGVLLLSSVIAILTTLGIVLSLLFESLRFFSAVSPIESPAASPMPAWSRAG